MYPTAQQSCDPATAPKRKVAKLHFVCLSILYLCTLFERMQLKVWRIENLRIEGPKSTSGGSKIEVQRVQNRGLEGFLAALGAAGRSWHHPEGVVVRLGAVLLGASWTAWRPSLGRLGVVLEAPEAIPGCLGASNGVRTKHSILHVVC